MRKPLGPAELDRKARVIVSVERTADETASTGVVVKPLSLDHFVSNTVRRKTLLVLEFYCWIIVIRE